MPGRYVFAPQARLEVKRAFQESKAQWGIAQRDRFRHQLNQTVKALARNPYMGVARPRWGEGVRSFIIGSYILVYVVTEVGIEITRLLHQRDDIARALGLPEDESID